MAAERKKGRFTFRTAAVLFILSSVFEILSIGSETLLLGAIRGGVIAGIYHLVYVALFAALGAGLWNGKSWGYPLVFATTVIYTLDKLQILFGRQVLEPLIASQMAGYESELQAQGIDAAMLLQAVMLMSVAVILCWWGFAWYTYIRRDYFQPGKP
jgi:hypothetical protein